VACAYITRVFRLLARKPVERALPRDVDALVQRGRPDSVGDVSANRSSCDRPWDRCPVRWSQCPRMRTITKRYWMGIGLARCRRSLVACARSGTAYAVSVFHPDLGMCIA
jgi:hypothetical protein